MRRDGAKIHNFRLSETEIFVRGQPKTQTGLNRLNKFQFTRIQFGSEKARCPKRSSEKSHRFCPTGKSATRRARSRRAACEVPSRSCVRIYVSFRRHAGMAGLAGGPTPSRWTQSGHRPASAGDEGDLVPKAHSDRKS